ARVGTERERAADRRAALEELIPVLSLGPEDVLELPDRFGVRRRKKANQVVEAGVHLLRVGVHARVQTVTLPPGGVAPLRVDRQRREGGRSDPALHHLTDQERAEPDRELAELEGPIDAR